MVKFLFLFSFVFVSCSGASPSTSSNAVLASGAQKSVGLAKVSWNGQTQLTRNIRYTKDGLSLDAPITLPDSTPTSISLSLPQEYALFQSAAMDEKDLLAKTDSNGVIEFANLDQLFPKDPNAKATLYLKSKEGVRLLIELRHTPKSFEFHWKLNNLPKVSSNFTVLAAVDIKNPNLEEVEMNLPNLFGFVSQQITQYTVSEEKNDYCVYKTTNTTDASIREEAQYYLVDASSDIEAASIFPGAKSYGFSPGETKQFYLISNSTIAKQMKESSLGGALTHENTGANPGMRMTHSGDLVSGGPCTYSQSDLRLGLWKNAPILHFLDESNLAAFRYSAMPVNDDPASKAGEILFGQSLEF